MTPRRILVLFVALILLVGGAAAAYWLDPDRRFEAIVRSLPTFEGRAATAWRADLDAPDATASVAAQRLTDGRAAAVPVLAWVVQDGGPSEARRRAADVIGVLGPDGRAAAPQLLALMTDPAPFARVTALKAVSKMAPKAGEPLPPELASVVPALTAQLPAVDALRVLSDYKTHSEPAITAIVPLLRDADPAVRWNAARTLGKIGPAAVRTGLPELVAQFGDADGLVREHAAEALGDMGPPAAAAVPDLANLFPDPEWKVRRDAVRALGQIGPAATPVLTKVLALKGDPQAEVRAAAAEAVRKIDPTLAGKP